jgi:hypothetical protein
MGLTRLAVGFLTEIVAPPFSLLVRRPSVDCRTFEPPGQLA